jgi:hypothetical protein
MERPLGQARSIEKPPRIKVVAQRLLHDFPIDYVLHVIPRSEGMIKSNTVRKKLIEVSIPLEVINRESAREKSIRHGHPSTLHLWLGAAPVGGVPGGAVRAARR